MLVPDERGVDVVNGADEADVGAGRQLGQDGLALLAPQDGAVDVVHDEVEWVGGRQLRVDEVDLLRQAGEGAGLRPKTGSRRSNRLI